MINVARNDNDPLVNLPGFASRYMAILGMWSVPGCRVLSQVATIHMDAGEGDYPSAMLARCLPAESAAVAAVLAGASV